MHHNLISLLHIISQINEINNSPLLSVDIRLVPLANTIILLREDKTSWIWNESDISQKDQEFTLPSIDLAHFLDLASNYELEDYFKRHNIDVSNIILDIEFSAWYPCFKTKEATIKFINEFNNHLDSIYLPQLHLISNGY